MTWIPATSVAVQSSFIVHVQITCVHLYQHIKLVYIVRYILTKNHIIFVLTLKLSVASPLTLESSAGLRPRICPRSLLQLI